MKLGKAPVLASLKTFSIGNNPGWWPLEKIDICSNNSSIISVTLQFSKQPDPGRLCVEELYAEVSMAETKLYPITYPSTFTDVFSMLIGKMASLFRKIKSLTRGAKSGFQEDR